MVNIKRIGSGILGAGAVLFVAAGAEAGLPTLTPPILPVR